MVNYPDYYTDRRYLWIGASYFDQFYIKSRIEDSLLSEQTVAKALFGQPRFATPLNGQPIHDEIDECV